MRHLLSLRLSLLSFIALGVFTVSNAIGADPPKAVWITVAEGDNCLIEGAKMPCSNVLQHLREVLKLPAGTHLHVRVEKDAAYESTAKVFQLLQKTEYVTKMGYVNVSDSNAH